MGLCVINGSRWQVDHNEKSSENRTIKVSKQHQDMWHNLSIRISKIMKMGNKGVI
jgi:hypothetical protein